MNILADESVEYPVIVRLRLDGHTIEALSEHPTVGLPDPQVLALAVQQHQLLLTADRDFGDLIMRDLSRAPAESVVLYRLKHIPIAQKVERVAEVFAYHASQVVGTFTVIEQQRLRHRPLS